MRIEDWLYTKFGTVLGTNIFPVEAPPNTEPPYCVYKQVSGTTETLTIETTINHDRWQVDTYPIDYRTGKLLVKQLIAAIPTSGLTDEVCVLAVNWDGPTDFYNPAVERHYQSTDLLIDYEI